MESVDVITDADGSKRTRRVYNYNREDSLTVEIPGVADLTLVACATEDDGPIGYRYLPSGSNRPYYSDNAATGKYIGEALADRIMAAGVSHAGFDADFTDADDGPGRKSSHFMKRANIVVDGNRVTVTVRERTKMVGGQSVTVPGEYVLNAWRNRVGTGTGAGKPAIVATDSADEL